MYPNATRRHVYMYLTGQNVHGTAARRPTASAIRRMPPPALYLLIIKSTLQRLQRHLSPIKHGC